MPGLFCLLVTLGVTVGLQVQSATHFVGVDGSGFSPSTLEIVVGDTVVWVNYDDAFPHTTTSDLPVINPNYWDGYLIDEFDTFSKTFNDAGSFTYFDQTDLSKRGSINVSLPAPSGIVLESLRIESGQYIFDASGLTAGKTNVLQTSTNLTSWTSVITNIAPDSIMTFTNPATQNKRFFRIYEVP